MRAIVQDSYGSADVLHPAEIDRPAVGDDDVLLQVRAASLNIGDWHVMTGLPYVARAALGLRRPKTRVRGMDVAGRVEAVGANVTRFTPGGTRSSASARDPWPNTRSRGPTSSSPSRRP
ncbi:alcohol dehydrogenase catalytic domain-containing protein [Cryobacterium sp. W22_MBD10_FK3]|uniref:alcohol dehydrogenase catalytic domain-containing protein n=1 Tax=Cryobacterium sp. W22_MBD10_FK3 TaxID=3240273 RepID=UPI003F8F9B45